MNKQMLVTVYPDKQLVCDTPDYAETADFEEYV